MLHVRLNLITTDPPLLGECIRHIENEVRPMVQGQPGNLGLSLLANPELGVAVLESFWVSSAALQRSEETGPLSGELARRAKATVTAENYRIPVFEGEALLDGGRGSG